MRTTIRIDDDLLRTLKERARRENASLAQVVNSTLRRGLTPQQALNQVNTWLDLPNARIAQETEQNWSVAAAMKETSELLRTTTATGITTSTLPRNKRGPPKAGRMAFRSIVSCGRAS